MNFMQKGVISQFRFVKRLVIETIPDLMFCKTSICWYQKILLQGLRSFAKTSWAYLCNHIFKHKLIKTKIWCFLLSTIHYLNKSIFVSTCYVITAHFGQKSFKLTLHSTRFWTHVYAQKQQTFPSSAGKQSKLNVHKAFI